MIILQKFNNLVQLFTYFNNEQVCRDYLEQIRWSGNITCPYEEGTCEADETYIGGQEKNKHQSKKTKGTQGRSLKTKIPVVGIIKRGGELRANVVDGTSGEILKKFIHENLEVGNPLNTDEWLGYKGLSKIKICLIL